MRVEIETQVSGVKKKAQDVGFPHSNEPEEIYEEELWVGVTLNGWRPMIRAPMKGVLRPMKPREERLIFFDVNRNEARTPLNNPQCLLIRDYVNSVSILIMLYKNKPKTLKPSRDRGLGKYSK
jgi:hypothetical protein